MIQFLKHNAGLKIFSLFLAIGLWHYATGEEGIEIKRSVPLEIKVKNSQISLLSSSAKLVHVTLSAPRALLSEMTSESIFASHEIGEEAKTAGDYSFRLEPSEIRVPNPQIRILQIEPAVIQVTLDELIVQKLPVRPNFTGEPSFGYQIIEEEMQLDPNAILVEGPKSEIDKMEFVLTEEINMVGRTRSFRRTVTLILPLNVKTVSETLIDAYIPIKEEFEEKSFQNVPVKVLRASESDEKISAEPSEVSFSLKGSIRHLDRLLPETIVAYVDASHLKSGEHNMPVEIVLPEEVSLKDDAPVVKVIIKGN